MLNSKKVIKASTLTLALVISVGASNVFASNDLNQQLKKTKESLNSIQSELNNNNAVILDYEGRIKEKNSQRMNVTDVITDLSDKRMSLEDKIYEITADIQTTLDRIFQLQEEITEISNEIKLKEDEIVELRERIEKNTNLFRERIRIAYKMGDAEKIEILMSSDDINDFLSRNKMITTITEHDNDLIKKLNQDKATLDKLVLELNGHKTSLEISKGNEEKEKLALEKQKDTQALLLSQVKVEETQNYALLSDLDNQIDKYESFLGEKLQDKAELSNTILELQSEINKIQNQIIAEEERIENNKKAEKEKSEKIEKQKQQLKDKKEELKKQQDNYEKQNNSLEYAWPSATTRITSLFGPRKAPLKGASTFHKGIDISGPYGTSIYATKSGVVSQVTYSSTGGNIVKINHGDGISSRYLHLQSVYVTKGQRVTQGQKIAAMGSTGNSTGPHLHFEILLNGSQVNPLPYIR